MTWTPSPSARNTVELVAHIAWAVGSIHQMYKGNPFQTETMEEADRDFRAWEAGVSEGKAMALLEDNSAVFLRWLHGVSEADCETIIDTPFRLGSAPLGLALNWMSMHMDFHTAQIQYLQTIYGDREWR